MDADVPQRIRLRNEQDGLNMKKKDDNFKFEDAMAQLEGLVARMESGDLDLGAMIRDFDLGKKLVARCTEELESIRQRIEKVTANGVEPMSIENLK